MKLLAYKFVNPKTPKPQTNGKCGDFCALILRKCPILSFLYIAIIWNNEIDINYHQLLEILIQTLSECLNMIYYKLKMMNMSEIFNLNSKY